jgi:minor extracellular serine protease Vpr
MSINRNQLPALALAMAVSVAVGAPTHAVGSGAAPQSDAAVAASSWTPGSSSEPIEAVVELEGQSLWDLYQSGGSQEANGVLAASTLQSLDSAIQRRQDVVAAEVEAAGASVIGRYTAALDALHVRTTRGQLGALAALPGVANVREAPIVSVTLADAVPQIGGIRARQELGLDGTGAVVAIIDSGVDYTHAVFGGPGTAAAHAANDENIAAGTWPASVTLPTARPVPALSAPASRTRIRTRWIRLHPTPARPGTARTWPRSWADKGPVIRPTEAFRRV